VATVHLACTKFHQDNFKTERLVCIETDRQTDTAILFVALIKNKYFMMSVKPLSMRYTFRDKKGYKIGILI